MDTDPRGDSAGVERASAAPAATRTGASTELQRRELSGESPAASTSVAASNPAAPAYLQIKTLYRYDEVPAPNVWVSVVNANDARSSFPAQFRLRSDRAGLCKKVELAPDVWLVGTLQLSQSRVQARLLPGTTQEVVVYVDRGYTLNVHVVDGAGQPVAGAEVWAFGGELNQFIAPGLFSKTDADADPITTKIGMQHTGEWLGITNVTGHLSIPCVDAGRVITAWAPGYAAAGADKRSLADLWQMQRSIVPAVAGTAPPRPGDPFGIVNLTIVLKDRDREIPGMVFDDNGRSVPGALVSVWPENDHYFEGQFERPLSVTVTDGSGKFTIRGLPGARFRVKARPLEPPAPASGDFIASPWTTTVDTSAADFQNCEIHLPKGAVVEGTVMNADRSPAAGVTVQAVLKDSQDEYFTSTAITDALGNYKIVGVVPSRVVLRALMTSRYRCAEEVVNLESLQRFRWNPIFSDR